MHAQSDKRVQLRTVVAVMPLIFQSWVARHQRVLGSDVQIVVDLPVYLPYFTGRMPQALRHSVNGIREM